jgi:hypothetical protein
LRDRKTLKILAIFKEASTDGSLSQDRISTWNWVACHGVLSTSGTAIAPISARFFTLQ